MKRRIPWPAGFSTALLACGGSGNGGGVVPPDPPDPPTCSAGLETPRAFTSLDFESPVAMLQLPTDALRWYLVEQGCTPPGAPGALQVSSFAQDLGGELYALDYRSGQILQLTFTE